MSFISTPRAEARTGGRLVIISPEFDGRGAAFINFRISSVFEQKVTFLLGLDSSCLIER